VLWQALEISKMRASDRPKKAKRPSNIADQFRELQWLRQKVQEAELEFLRNGSHRADIVPPVDDKDRREQSPSGWTPEGDKEKRKA